MQSFNNANQWSDNVTLKQLKINILIFKKSNNGLQFAQNVNPSVTLMPLTVNMILINCQKNAQNVNPGEHLERRFRAKYEHLLLTPDA